MFNSDLNNNSVIATTAAQRGTSAPRFICLLLIYGSSRLDTHPPPQRREITKSDLYKNTFLVRGFSQSTEMTFRRRLGFEKKFISWIMNMHIVGARLTINICLALLESTLQKWKSTIRERVQKIDEWLRRHKSDKVTGRKRPNCSFIHFLKAKKMQRRCKPCTKLQRTFKKAGFAKIGKFFLVFIYSPFSTIFAEFGYREKLISNI